MKSEAERGAREDTGQLLTPLYCWGPRQGGAASWPRGQSPWAPERGCTASLTAGHPARLEAGRGGGAAGQARGEAASRVGLP